jgi:protein SCO1
MPVITGGGDYTKDLTATVYIMDREGRFIGTLDPHENANAQLAKLRRLIGG